MQPSGCGVCLLLLGQLGAAQLFAKGRACGRPPVGPQGIGPWPEDIRMTPAFPALATMAAQPARPPGAIKAFERLS